MVRRLGVVGLSVVLASVLIQVLHFGFSGWLILVVLVALLIIRLFVWARTRPILPAVVFVASFALFEMYVGHYYLILDLFLICMSIILVHVTLTRRPVATHRGWPLRGRLTSYIQVWLVFWLLASVADTVTQRTSVTLKGSRAVSSGTSINVGLALSGGGYRAALFHAGVLSVLEREHIPVTRISSVSGGAIIASFYALGGSPEQFVELVRGHRFNLKREFFDFPNAVRLIGSERVPGLPYTLLPVGDFSRTNVQAGMLDRIFIGYRFLHDSQPPGSVRLMICTTDLLSSQMIGVTDEGLVVQQIVPATQRSKFINNTGADTPDPPTFLSYGEESGYWPLSLAKLVAASGAFPGALRGLPISDLDLEKPESSRTTHRLLVDGGLGDNLGLVLLKDAHQLSQFRALLDERDTSRLANSARSWTIANWQSSLFIASDASAIPAIPEHMNFVLEATRSVDISNLAGGGDAAYGRIREDVAIPPAILVSPRSILIKGIDLRRGIDEDTDLFEEVDFPVRRASPPRCGLSDDCSAQVSMVTLPDSVLRFIIEGMPSVKRKDATQILKDLENRNLYQLGLWRAVTWSTGSLEDKLHDLVKQELWRCLVEFLRMPTLEDQPSAYTSETIFRLGQYLTYLNLPIIQREMQRPAEGEANKSLGVTRTGTPRDLDPR
jgi:predicted acylesterase/phospholipase RssA